MEQRITSMVHGSRPCVVSCAPKAAVLADCHRSTMHSYHPCPSVEPTGVHQPQRRRDCLTLEAGASLRFLHSSRALQGAQEGDELLPLLDVELEAEFVALDGTLRLVRRRESSRYVRVLQSVWVEHFLQARHRTVVQVATAIPDSLERGDLIKARPFTGV